MPILSSVAIVFLSAERVIAQSELFAPLPMPRSTISELSESTSPAENSLPEVEGISTVSAASTFDYELTSELGRYSVVMPREPESASHITVVSQGRLDWTVDAARQGNSLYAVAYADLPLETLLKGREEVLASLENRPFLNEFDWQVITQSGQFIMVDGYPGREYLHSAEGLLSALRLTLVNRRIYIVMASSADLMAIDEYMASFSVDSPWRSFRSEAGRFSVNVPMAPVVTSHVTEWQGDLIEWQQFTIYNLMAAEDAYQIAYADLPATALMESEEATLEAIAQQVFSTVGIEDRVGVAKSISGQTYPGKEYLANIDGKAYVVRFYLKENRVYGILAGSYSLNNLSTFLNSFSIL